jgi:hypothetical protein
MDGGAGVALDRERGHAVVAEEHRRRQPHEAAADDQDRDVCVAHGATVIARRERATSGIGQRSVSAPGPVSYDGTTTTAEDA